MTPNAVKVSGGTPRATNPVAANASHHDSYLVFEVDGQPYACPIDQIEHLMLLEDAPLRPSPEGSPSWQVGLLETREEPEGIPTVSLRTLWALPALPEAANRKWQAILIVRLSGRRHALLVDGCRAVLSRLPQKSMRFRFSTALKGVNGRAFDLAMPWKQSLLVVLNLDELVKTMSMSREVPAPVLLESR